jgi:hypothetical protein
MAAPASKTINNLSGKWVLVSYMHFLLLRLRRLSFPFPILFFGTGIYLLT